MTTDSVIQCANEVIARMDGGLPVVDDGRLCPCVSIRGEGGDSIKEIMAIACAIDSTRGTADFRGFFIEVARPADAFDELTSRLKAGGPLADLFDLEPSSADFDAFVVPRRFLPGAEENQIVFCIRKWCDGRRLHDGSYLAVSFQPETRKSNFSYFMVPGRHVHEAAQSLEAAVTMSTAPGTAAPFFCLADPVTASILYMTSNCRSGGIEPDNTSYEDREYDDLEPGGDS